MNSEENKITDENFFLNAFTKRVFNMDSIVLRLLKYGGKKLRLPVESSCDGFLCDL